MPCHTTQTSKVDIKVARTNLDLFIAALRSLGIAFTECQRVIVLPARSDINAIKRAYSFQVVQAAAARFRWSLTKINNSRWLATKRVSTDKLHIEILRDGTIKITAADKISDWAKHKSAEGFFEFLIRYAGGKTTVERRGLPIDQHQQVSETARQTH